MSKLFYPKNECEKYMSKNLYSGEIPTLITNSEFKTHNNYQEFIDDSEQGFGKLKIKGFVYCELNEDNNKIVRKCRDSSIFSNAIEECLEKQLENKIQKIIKND